MSLSVPFIPNVINERSERWLQLFRQHLPECHIAYPADLTEAQKKASEVAIVANPALADLVTLPSLKWIHSTWAGVEKVIPVARERGVPLVRMQDPSLAKVMAEAVLTWSLFLYRRIPDYQQQQQYKIWRQIPLPDINDVTVAILGMGNMGLASCQLLKHAGFRVTGWQRNHNNAAPCECYYGAEQLPEVLQQADIVVVLLPLTADTCGLISRQQLALMKPGASLINFGRAGVVDYQALQDALQQQHLYHAVLDVYEQEPLTPDAKEWQLPSCTLLPHVAAPTNPETASVIIAENIRRYTATGCIPPAVDFERGY